MGVVGCLKLSGTSPVVKSWIGDQGGGLEDQRGSGASQPKPLITTTPPTSEELTSLASMPSTASHLWKGVGFLELGQAVPWMIWSLDKGNGQGHQQKQSRWSCHLQKSGYRNIWVLLGMVHGVDVSNNPVLLVRLVISFST